MNDRSALFTAVVPFSSVFSSVFTENREKTLGDSQLLVSASSFFNLLQVCTVAHFHASEVGKDGLFSRQSAYFPAAPLQKVLAFFIYIGTTAQGSGELKKEKLIK